MESIDFVRRIILIDNDNDSAADGDEVAMRHLEAASI